LARASRLASGVVIWLVLTKTLGGLAQLARASRLASGVVIGLVLTKTLGGLAQLARASALHAEGHRFDSDILHQKSGVTVV
jgi:hypothetical protein